MYKRKALLAAVLIASTLSIGAPIAANATVASQTHVAALSSQVKPLYPAGRAVALKPGYTVSSGYIVWGCYYDGWAAAYEWTCDLVDPINGYTLGHHTGSVSDGGYFRTPSYSYIKSSENEQICGEAQAS